MATAAEKRRLPATVTSKKTDDEAMRELVHALKRYADHARARFGLGAAELFTDAEVGGKSKAIGGDPSAPPALPASAGEQAEPFASIWTSWRAVG